MKKSNIGMAIILLMLCTCNAGLDYSAVCKYMDIDMFIDVDVKNLLAFIISGGCALTLLILPRIGAQEFARGSKAVFSGCMAGCGVVAVVLAALRAVADASSTTMGIDGTVSSQMTASDAIFVLVMLVLSVGEVASSFFLRHASIREERARLTALVKRLDSQVRQIDERVAAVDRIASKKKEQAAAAAKAAGETLYLGLYENAGEMQNAFIGYTNAIERDREAFDRSVDDLVANKASLSSEPERGLNGDAEIENASNEHSTGGWLIADAA